MYKKGSDLQKDYYKELKASFVELQNELKAVQQRIDDRHRLGANWEKLKGRLEKVNPDDPKHKEDFDNLAVAEFDFVTSHNDSLAEVQEWKTTLCKARLTPIYYQLRQYEVAFFRSDAPALPGPPDPEKAQEVTDQPAVLSTASETVSSWWGSAKNWIEK